MPRHIIHHGHRTFHSMNLSIQNTRTSHRPTEAASTATSPTDHCILCMPRHQPIQPARPVLSTATCIAFPSLFQSHQHNTHPAHIFRVPAAIPSTSFRLPSPGHLHTCIDHGAQPRSLLTTTIVPRAGATALSRAHNLLRNHGRRELISLYQNDCEIQNLFRYPTKLQYLNTPIHVKCSRPGKPCVVSFGSEQQGILCEFIIAAADNTGPSQASVPAQWNTTHVRQPSVQNGRSMILSAEDAGIGWGLDGGTIRARSMSTRDEQEE